MIRTNLVSKLVYQINLYSLLLRGYNKKVYHHRTCSVSQPLNTPTGVFDQISISGIQLINRCCLQKYLSVKPNDFVQKMTQG